MWDFLRGQTKIWLEMDSDRSKMHQIILWADNLMFMMNHKMPKGTQSIPTTQAIMYFRKKNNLEYSWKGFNNKINESVLCLIWDFIYNFIYIIDGLSLPPPNRIEVSKCSPDHWQSFQSMPSGISTFEPQPHYADSADLHSSRLLPYMVV